MGPAIYIHLEIYREPSTPSACAARVVSAHGERGDHRFDVEERLRFSFQSDRAAERFEREIRDAMAADRADLIAETGIRAVTIVCDAHEDNRAEIVHVEGDVLRFVAEVLRAGGHAAGRIA